MKRSFICCSAVLLLLWLPISSTVLSQTVAPNAAELQLDQEIQQVRQQIKLDFEAGRLAEALKGTEQRLELETKRHGPESELLTDVMQQLVSIYEEMDDFDNARRIAKDIIQFQQELFGDDHWKVRDAEIYLADVDKFGALTLSQRLQWQSAGDKTNNVLRMFQAYQHYQAKDLAMEVLETFRNLKGDEDHSVITALNNAGMALLHSPNPPEKAEGAEYLKQCLELARKIYSDAHPTAITLKYNMAFALRSAGQIDEALELVLAAVEAATTVHGTTAANTMEMRNGLAIMYSETGDLQRALALQEEVLDLRQKQDATSIDTAMSHYALAMLMQKLRRVEASLLNFDQAEKILRQHSPDHPRLPIVLGSRARLLARLQQYAAALEDYEQANRLLAEDPTQENVYAQLENDRELGIMYSGMGELAEAQRIFQLALELGEAKFGPNSPALFRIIEANAIVRFERNQTNEAKQFLDRLVKLQGTFPQPGFELGLKNSLATILHKQGDLPAAITLYQQALQICEKLEGTKSNSYARLQGNMAVALQDNGQLEEAEKHFADAVEVLETNLPTNHFQIIQAKSNFAGLFHQTGDTDRCLQLANEAFDGAVFNLSRSYLSLAETQQLNAKWKFSRFLDGYLSSTLDVDIPDSEKYRRLMAWKGMVFGYQRLLRSNLRASEEFSRSHEIATQLSAIMHDEKIDPTHRKRLAAELTAELNSAQQALAGSLDLKAISPVSPDELTSIQDNLDNRAVVLDFVAFTKATPPAAGRPATSTGFEKETHLMVFVVSGKHVKQIDLGPALPIRESLEAWRREVGGYASSPDAYQALGKQLNERLWQPIQQTGLTDGAQLLIVSPDGVLGAFPFGAIPLDDQRYLLDDFAIVRTHSARMLPHPDEKGRLRRSPSFMVMAEMDYGGDGHVELPIPAGGLRLGTSSTLNLSPLPLDAQMLQNLTKSFSSIQPDRKPTEFRGPAATDRNFVERGGDFEHIYLHTHGIVSESLTSRPAIMGDAPVRFDTSGESTVGWNPGVASSLHFTKSTDDDAYDGLLTALEAGNVDLEQTRTVFVAACQSSVGPGRLSEGLFGLQRALRVAGAEYVLASCWEVDHLMTQQLVARFYHYLWDVGLPEPEALRRAQLDVREHGGDSAHPAYWAGWTISGVTADVVSNFELSAVPAAPVAATTANSTSIVDPTPTGPPSGTFAGLAAALLLVVTVVLVGTWIRLRGKPPTPPDA